MSENFYTRALVQGAEFHGSTQSLASALRVPEATLLRWLAGRAQMPVQAFHELVASLVEHEKRAGLEAPAATAREKVAFNIMDVHGQCAGCGTAEFLAPAPVQALRMTSILQCASCARPVAHGELLCALATKAMREPRNRRQLARCDELLARSDRALNRSSALLGSSERRIKECGVLRGRPASREEEPTTTPALAARR